MHRECHYVPFSLSSFLPSFRPFVGLSFLPSFPFLVSCHCYVQSQGHLVSPWQLSTRLNLAIHHNTVQQNKDPVFSSPRGEATSVSNPGAPALPVRLVSHGLPGLGRKGCSLPGELPSTSCGKIPRSAARLRLKQCMDGTFSCVHGI